MPMTAEQMVAQEFQALGWNRHKDDDKVLTMETVRLVMMNMYEEGIITGKHSKR